MATILLIADEDQRVKNIVRFTFEQMDYKVLSTDSGMDVVSKAKEMKPDIVLIDVSLSDKNGFEASREIKSNPILKNTPVILLISSFVTFDKTKVAESLADDFIIKPFVFEEIIQKVKSLTASSNNYRTKLPIAINREGKEAFAKSILVLFFIFIVLTVSNLLTKNTPSTPNAQSSLNSSNREFKNVPGINNPPTIKSSPGHLFKRKQEINITLGKNGDIYINDTSYTVSEMKSGISKLAANFGNKIEDQYVFLRADATVPYGNVMKVAAEIKKSGIKKLELDTVLVSVSESEQLGDRETSKENNKISEYNELISRELPKLQVAKQEKPKATYTVSADAAKENGEKTTNDLKFTKTSAALPTKETEDNQVTWRKSINRLIEESKKKIDEKKDYREKQTTTSRTEIEKASGKLKKTATKKKIPKHIKTSINKQQKVKGNRYIVQKGETLWSISKKFNTSVKNLKITNKLTNDRVNSGKVLIVPEIKEEPQDKTVASKRNKNNNFSKDIKITEWRLYVAWGIPTIHNVTIENTSNTTYANVKIKAQYYYSYSTDTGKLETAEVEGTLPVIVPPYTKKTYLQNGLQLKQGSSCGMFGGAKEIKIIAANPIGKDLDLYSSR